MATEEEHSVNADDQPFPVARAAVALALIAGLLIAILVPLTLSQIKRQHDARSKADLQAVTAAIEARAALGLEPQITVSGSRVVLDGEFIRELGAGSVLGRLEWTSVDDWCLDITNERGDVAIEGYTFEAGATKVKDGQCPGRARASRDN